MKYSQNQEEQYILNYFLGQKGTFLDIGAADGVSLSNTRALAERGWKGICIEPCPSVYEKLTGNYILNKDVKCYQYAIGTKNGVQEMFFNDTYYSTLSQDETKRWVSDSNITYTKGNVDVKDFKTFLKENPGTYDFISLDAEGLDYEILSQINLTKVGCRMICVETNGKETQKYIDYIAQFGLKVRHVNGENLIMIL